MTEHHIDVPVLIVGAGPAGLTAALALARYGVDCLLVERHPGTAHTPRAHIVNQRTVEILRHLGVEERLHAVATPQEMMRNNLWVTSLAGDEVARLETWGTGDHRSSEYRTASPCPMANCPQTVLEPMLLECVREAGVDVRFRYQFDGMVPDADGVTSTVRNLVTGEVITVRSEYLLGADGARSAVLDKAGLTVTGPAGLAEAANIWFEADLSRYLAHRPGVLTWNVMPGPLPPLRLGTLICHRPFTEFVLVTMFDSGPDARNALTEEQLIARVHAMIGDDTVEVRIKGISGWQVNAQTAQRYSTGRVFCMGDAVHRHPPSNGLGLNMSIADAYNLCWKLALVRKGVAAPSLLDTYSIERQPVGAQGVARAFTSLRELAEVDAALGYTPGQSAADGWALLRELDQPGAAGDARRAALRRAVELTNYQFNAHGVELGYRYGGPAVVADATPCPAPARDPELHYEATTRPGARVPHARIERPGGVRLSTMDLVDGLGFALLTGPGGEPWRAAAAEVSARGGVPITVHLIGRAGASDPADPYDEWARLREVDADGCVLVRPDRHVGWRAMRLTADSGDRLAAAVATILGHHGAGERTEPAALSGTVG